MNYYIENIIDKELLGEASSHEKQQLAEWISESSENAELYDSYVEIFNLTINYTPNPTVSFDANKAYTKHLELLVDENNEDLKQKKVAKIFSLSRISSVAAILILGIGAMFLFSTKKNTITAEDSVMFVSLSDGTEVWLDKGASLIYDSEFNVDHRNVSLVGKAFFDVQRNENISFNIISDDLSVSVLGTSFTVDGTSKNVSVKSGIVKVAHDQDEVKITANEKVVLKKGNLVKRELTQSDVLWRNPNLSFDNAKIEHVIADLNLYYDNKFKLENDNDNISCELNSGTLKGESFETIIQVLKSNFDIEVTEINGFTNIKVKDCK